MKKYRFFCVLLALLLLLGGLMPGVLAQEAAEIPEEEVTEESVSAPEETV